MNATERDHDGGGEVIRFPLSGELVDEDHDGEPDRFDHDDKPGGEVEPRPDAGEVDGPVVHAELVDDVEYATARWRREIETRPVVPVWLRDAQQRGHATRWAYRYVRHTSQFHSVRVPLYVTRVFVASPRGAVRVVGWWARWVTDSEALPLRLQAVLRDDVGQYMQLAKLRRDRIKHRAIVTVVVVVVVVVGLVVAGHQWHPAWWVAGGVAAAGLGLVGRRRDKPIIAPAIVGQEATKLVPEVVERAFIAAGLASEQQPITFPQPIQRDGQGWLAVVDLSYGRTFDQAAKKKTEIASGLSVNEVTVFLDPDAVSARRVRLWVSDIDVFAQAPVPSPLIKAERWDFWQPIPFGLDARDRLVAMPLVWSSLLVGAKPRMGKTFAARLPAAAGALDPYVRLYVFNGKGDRSWKPFEKVAHRYGSGVRDEVIDLLVAALSDLVDDMNDRFERMSQLPADVCPEDKLTPAMSRNQHLNMPLTLVCIDEIQRYLEHKEHGATILDLLVDLAKVGPAAGIMLNLATQKPDAKVIPDALRGQIGTRLAMKVMTYQASETILGAGTYQAGMDASRFLQRHKGVGILLGADDSELAEEGGRIIRTHLLKGPDLEAICDRGRTLRVDADLLTGMAAGEQVATAGRTTRVLHDVAEVFAPGETRVWTSELLARLSEHDPGAYDGWTDSQLAAALKPYGVEPGQVWGKTADGKSANRRGYTRDDITDALAAQLDKGR